MDGDSLLGTSSTELVRHHSVCGTSGPKPVLYEAGQLPMFYLVNPRFCAMPASHPSLTMHD